MFYKIYRKVINFKFLKLLILNILYNGVAKP
jgi:hypothetical protein